MLNGERNRVLTIIIAVILIIIPLLIKSNYYIRLINLCGIYLLLTVGLNIITGYTGNPNMAQTAFWGIGAYASGLLSIKLGLSFWLSLPLSGLVAAMIGVLVGIPTLKLKVFHFAIGTIAFGQIIQLFFKNLEITGGPSGLKNIPTPKIGNYVFDSDFSYYYIILFVIFILISLAYRLEHSKYGRALKAIKESELALQMLGINVSYIKVLAFGVSTFYAGIAGSLYAHLFTYISPDTFSFFEAVKVLTMLYIGQAGSIIGAIIGSIVLTILPEALRFMKVYYMAIYGIGIVIIFAYLPNGLIGLIRHPKIRKYIKNLELR